MSKFNKESGGRNSDRHNVPSTADVGVWLQDWKWNWWVTLTFSNDVSRGRADAILDDFLEELEATCHDSLSCLIAQEQKTFSGAGKPAGRVHFHMLVGHSGRLHEKMLKDMWNRSEYGGSRTSGASAYVKEYDPLRGAAIYMQKFSKDRAWDYRFKNLEFLSPVKATSSDNCARGRRKLRRAEQRRATAAAGSPQVVERSLATAMGRRK